MQIVHNKPKNLFVLQTKESVSRNLISKQPFNQNTAFVLIICIHSKQSYETYVKHIYYIILLQPSVSLT